SVLISRRIEPVDPDSRICEVVYHRHIDLGVRAEAGESTSRRNVVPSALNASEQRQPLRDRIAGVERNALETVLEGSAGLKRPAGFKYRARRIPVKIIKGDGPAIGIKDTIHE